MAKVSKFQHDVVIRCNHGVTDGPAEYVSRYRFMAEQDVWVAVDAGGTVSTDVGGPEDDGWFTAAASSPGTRHQQQKIRCRTCSKELSIGADRLQSLLGLVAPSEELVTITGLQRTIAHSAAQRRP